MKRFLGRNRTVGAFALGMPVAGLASAAIFLLTAVPALQEGFSYRPQDNAREWMQQTISYSGSSSCSDCHRPEAGQWRSSAHLTVQCEVCHGPGHPSAKAKMATSTVRAGEACKSCHSKVVGRPVWFRQMEMKEPMGGLECTSCHDPHSPRMSR